MPADADSDVDDRQMTHYEGDDCPGGHRSAVRLARELYAAASPGDWKAFRDKEGRMGIHVYDEADVEGLPDWYMLAEFFVNHERRSADERNARLTVFAVNTALAALEALEKITEGDAHDTSCLGYDACSCNERYAEAVLRDAEERLKESSHD